VATRASLRTQLRRMLADTASSGYTWSDDLLNDFLARAMATLAVDLPLERRMTVSLVSGQAEYPLPADFLAGLAVVADGEMMPPAPRGEYGWWWRDDKLLIQPPPRYAREVELQYIAERLLPSDDAAQVDLSGAEELLVVTRAAAEAYLWWEDQAARRGVTVPSRSSQLLEEYRRLLQGRRQAASRRVGGWL
jgi:hypothetical protein